MDVPFLIFSIVAVIFFLAMNAFFVIAEFAIVRVRKSQMELAAEEGIKHAKDALYVTENVNLYLSACQLGVTLASLALGWLGEPLFANLLHPLFELFHMPQALITTISVAIGFFLMTSLHVVAGELIPKSMAIFNTEKCALVTSKPLIIFYKVTFPVMWLFNSITHLFVKLTGHENDSEHDAYTGDEIKLLMDESADSGLIDVDQTEIVGNVLDLGEKDAASVMKPRTDVVFLDTDDELDDILSTIKQYRYSRYPVCTGDADHLCGFVHIKDLYDQDVGLPVLDWNIRNLPAVPETCSISHILDVMTDEHTEMVAVVDEHGGTCGIATLSDCIAQILGRIDDEYRHASEDEIKKAADGTFEVDGLMSIEDLRDIVGFDVDEDYDVDTVAGLVMDLLQRIAVEGDTCTIKRDTDTSITNITFKVLSMDKMRIEKVKIKVSKALKETD